MKDIIKKSTGLLILSFAIFGLVSAFPNAYALQNYVSDSFTLENELERVAVVTFKAGPEDCE